MCINILYPLYTHTQLSSNFPVDFHLSCAFLNARPMHMPTIPTPIKTTPASSITARYHKPNNNSPSNPKPAPSFHYRTTTLPVRSINILRAAPNLPVKSSPTAFAEARLRPFQATFRKRATVGLPLHPLASMLILPFSRCPSAKLLKIRQFGCAGAGDCFCCQATF